MIVINNVVNIKSTNFLVIKIYFIMLFVEKWL